MKLVPVSELFEVRYGTSLELNALEERAEGVPFVSRTTQNNGVSARVAPVPGVDAIQGGVLSVALGGSPMATFLQEEPFYSGRDVSYLMPRTEMSREAMLYYAACLQANRYKFNYGRQANRSLPGLLVPAQTEVPAWISSDFREGAESIWHSLQTGSLSLARPCMESFLTDRWQSFRYDELFDVRKGKRLTKEDMLPGTTLYIGATDSNNGITEKISQGALHPGGQLTVSYNGSVAEAFYQPDPFWASDDVNVLYPKFKMSVEVALFLVTLIRMEKYRYNYGRKWKLEVMKASVLRLPVTPASEPDWRTMEEVVRACPAYAVLPLNKGAPSSCNGHES
jgi:hypothetical protein